MRAAVALSGLDMAPAAVTCRQITAALSESKLAGDASSLRFHLRALTCHIIQHGIGFFSAADQAAVINAAGHLNWVGNVPHSVAGQETLIVTQLMPIEQLSASLIRLINTAESPINDVLLVPKVPLCA